MTRPARLSVPGIAHPVTVLALVTGLHLAACTVKPAPVAPTPTDLDVAVEAHADALMARAAAAEPEITAALRALATEAGAELVKLETRLKGRASTVRKIKKIMEEKPGIQPGDVRLNDSVRYTLVVADEPPGHHVATIREVLGRLEKSRHRLVKLKNYWPRGDNYSGVNSVLENEAGLRWELQFHSPASQKTAGAHHDLYERLRAVDTPAPEKVRVFEQMAAAWDQVAIPKRMLEPKSLHPNEQIIELPRPAGDRP